MKQWTEPDAMFNVMPNRTLMYMSNKTTLYTEVRLFALCMFMSTNKYT